MPSDLANKLLVINAYCPLPVFVETARYHQSLATLDTDKTKLPSGTEQSIEWGVINDNRSLLALSNKHNDELLALVSSTGESLISDIDSAMTECKQLKSERDNRLLVTQFKKVSIGLNCISISANSAKGLADKLQGLGDDKAYWAFCAFVGNSSELEPMKELFL